MLHSRWIWVLIHRIDKTFIKDQLREALRKFTKRFSVDLSLSSLPVLFMLNQETPPPSLTKYMTFTS